MQGKTKEFASIWVCQGCEATNSNNADVCLHCGRERKRRERLGIRH